MCRKTGKKHTLDVVYKRMLMCLHPCDCVSMLCWPQGGYHHCRQVVPDEHCREVLRCMHLDPERAGSNAGCTQSMFYRQFYHASHCLGQRVGNSLRANTHHQPTCESSVVYEVGSHAKLAAAVSPCRRTSGHHFLQPHHCMDMCLMRICLHLR